MSDFIYTNKAYLDFIIEDTIPDILAAAGFYVIVAMLGSLII